MSAPYIGPELPRCPVVSTEWLAQRLGDPIVRIVDIRGEVRPPPPPGVKVKRYRPKREDYEKAHIPGAVFVDWTADIVDPDDPIPSQVALPARFAELMARLGIGDDTVVVPYDDYNAIFAGRLAWALRYYGHDAVRVLDGGWKAWVAEGRPVTSDVPRFHAAGPFTPRALPGLRRTADEVEAAILRGALLIDARPADQFEGKASAASRAGHIPTARNVHYARLIDAATGRFAPPDKLRAVFAEAGIDVAKLPSEVILYCNGGISCTVPGMALALLGREDASVYDGSWNEWGNDAKRPIEKG